MLVTDARSSLIGRARDLLVMLNLDPATGPPDLGVVLDDAIGSALLACALPASSPVADADLDALSPWDYPKFRDAARIELLKILRDRASSRFDQTTGLDGYRFSQVAQRLQETIESEQAGWDARYLAGSQSPYTVAIDSPYLTPGHRPGQANPYGARPPW